MDDKPLFTKESDKALHASASDYATRRKFDAKQRGYGPGARSGPVWLAWYEGFKDGYKAAKIASEPTTRER